MGVQATSVKCKIFYLSLVYDRKEGSIVIGLEKVTTPVDVCVRTVV